jgi:hypothetical protein
VIPSDKERRYPVKVRVARSILDPADAHASAAGVSFSRLVELALAFYLKNHPASPDA